MEEDHKIPIILGRPFLATAHAMIDVFNKKISFEDDGGPVDFNKLTLFAANTKESEKQIPKLKELSSHLEYFFFNDNQEFSDVVKAEIVKLLDDGLIYAISDSPWVSPIHVVPKKRGMTVITNENDELVPTRTVTGWRDANFIFSNECIQAFNILKDKLKTAPVIVAPDWNLDFELMCDVSDYAVGAVLGQRIDKRFHLIYYASKPMNDAQEHYTTTKKELLAVVYAFDKFRSYLIMSKMIVYTDHSALKYLFSNQDAKPRLIRLENPELEKLNEEAIRDSFPNKYLMEIHVREPEADPWSCSDVVTSACVILSWLIMPPRMMTRSAGRVTATPRGGRTGGRTGRGGGRLGGRSGDQGDGRNDGQGGQVRKVNDGVDGVPDFSTIIA
ncbi:reverse transcriptase domain-containing protein [Tanacetum coccineum]